MKHKAKNLTIEEKGKGHQVVFSVGAQTFYLQQRGVFKNDEWTSLEYAEWYKKQLETAFNNLK